MDLNLSDIFPGAVRIAFFQSHRSDHFQPGLIHEKMVPFGIVAQACAGEYEISCAGQTVRVRKPEAFLTPANQPMRITHHGDRHHRFDAQWMHFSFVLYQNIDLTSLLELPLRVDPDHGRELGTIMKELIQPDSEDPLLALHQSIRRREFMWRVMRIVCDLAKFKPDAMDRIKAGQRLAPLLEYLNTNLANPISVRQMAELVNMSESRFYGFFKDKMGSSPMEYAKNIRLNEAATQFSVTSRLLKEVAAVTGFSNPFHLSREFKHRFGLSPKQYRAVHLT